MHLWLTHLFLSEEGWCLCTRAIDCIDPSLFFASMEENITHSAVSRYSTLIQVRTIIYFTRIFLFQPLRGEVSEVARWSKKYRNRKKQWITKISGIKILFRAIAIFLMTRFKNRSPELGEIILAWGVSILNLELLVGEVVGCTRRTFRSQFGKILPTRCATRWTICRHSVVLLGL